MWDSFSEILEKLGVFNREEGLDFPHRKQKKQGSVKLNLSHETWGFSIESKQYTKQKCLVPFV